MKDLLIYSTIAGEIPLLVHKNIPKCFVEYEQYLELKAESDKKKDISFDEFYNKIEVDSDGEVGIYAANLLYHAGYRV